MISRLVRRLTLVATGLFVLVWVQAPAASATPIKAVAAGSDRGGILGMLKGLSIKDSSGVPIFKYELHLDRGGVISPWKMLSAWPTELLWQIYSLFVGIGIWFLDWVLSLDWLPILASPLIACGDAMQTVVNRLGVGPAFLTVTAVVGALFMMRGKWATGLFEIGLSVVIAAIATGLLAQPVRMVAGTDGWIERTTVAGLELSSAISGGDGSGNTDELRKEHTTMLVDAFLRTPAQIVNFGKVLPKKCQSVYTDALLKGVENEGDSDVRDKVKDCDEAAGKYAENPSVGMLVTIFFYYPSVWTVIILILVMAGSIVLAAGNIMARAVMLIWHLLTGQLPGSARGPLWITVGELLTSLILLIFPTVFLGIVMVVIKQFFVELSNPVLAVLVVDIVIVVAIVQFLRQRGRISKSADKIAAGLAKRPGASPASLPTQSAGLSSAAMKAGDLALRLKTASAISKSGSKQPQSTTSPSRAAVQPAAAGSGPGANASSAPADGAPHRKRLLPGPGPGSEEKPAAWIRSAGKSVVKTGLVLGSGGTGRVALAALDARKAKQTPPTVGQPAPSSGRSAALKTRLNSSGATHPTAASSVGTGAAGAKISPGVTAGPDSPVKQKYDRVVSNGQVLLVPKQEVER